MTTEENEKTGEEDAVISAAKQAADRDTLNRLSPEPSLASRFGQIGVLGWATVVPILIGLVAGRWLDRMLSTGIMFSAALIVVGAFVGMWSAWRWMHRP